MPDKSASVAPLAGANKEQDSGLAVSTVLVRDLLATGPARNSALVSLNALDELFALGMMELS
jgi:hypothetical protein